MADDANGKDMEDQRAEYVHDPEVHGRDFRVEGNDVRDYVGVDPEYMTYANPGDAPMLTDTERFMYTSQYDHLEGNADEEVADEEVDESRTDSKDESDKKSDTKKSAPAPKLAGK
jgi:hypothetical protein